MGQFIRELTSFPYPLDDTVKVMTGDSILNDAFRENIGNLKDRFIPQRRTSLSYSLSSSLPVPLSTWTILPFNTKIYDIGDDWNSTSYELSGNGIYSLYLYIEWESRAIVAGDRVSIALYYDSSYLYRDRWTFDTAATMVTNRWLNCSFEVVSGFPLGLAVAQNNSLSSTFTVSSSNTIMQISRIR